jgi:hypothetical protein
MKLIRSALPIAFLALACAALPASADPPARPSDLRSDILYTHRGEFVQVKPMRPLTLNAHVEQFAYDPLGLEIAITGSEPQGENTVHFVKTIDVRTGHEINRFTFTAPSDSQETALMLRGWSTSGKYLMLQRFSPDPNAAQTAVSEFLRWDLSTNPPTTRSIDPQEALPPEEQSPDLEGSAECYPSPNGRWLAFTQSIHTLKDNGKPGPDKNAYVLYDPEQNKFLPLTLPANTSFYSWSDARHLKIWQNAERKQLDVVTGEISPLTTSPDASPPDVSKHYPDLSLDTEQRRVDDIKGSGGYFNEWIVWIRRTAFGKAPLGAAAAGLIPAEADTFQTTWSPTSVQAVWSPTGKQVAFIANDDLYVTDLVTASIETPKEKLAVGLSLTCADERVLAMTDLKEIGLGIVQYTQDNDEKLPMADGFIKTIYPYLKTMDVFQVGGHPFVYEQPADLALAKMDSPATTEEGYMDLPCARVVLFADGHVKSFAKQETTP